jgi:hypothetical protein
MDAIGTRFWSFVAWFGCLLIDEDGIHDPRLVNGRLLLGMNGTMSEMELSLLSQRSAEALKSKARRGQLFLSVPVRVCESQARLHREDPDLRVQEAISFVFRKFAELQSIRQVHLWLRQEQIALPAVNYRSRGNGRYAAGHLGASAPPRPIPVTHRPQGAGLTD